MKKNKSSEVNYPLAFDTVEVAKQEVKNDQLKVISKNSIFANVKRASELIKKHDLLEFFGT